ncbi:FHA domain protein [Aquisphaera giovannonii]|uniref:FHA domain protein n=1 Tax=Aquisphaera giovannonii TaxID=406548 RepID=A0A5B9WBF7_9BACT|nr:FHA domain-containing protein [Aquisphaera giovannonii]QEH37594.1 FHA domain protein [Aquisphaera giovannonii]
MANIKRPGPQNIPPERSGTLIETEEEVRQAILSGLKGQQQAAPVDRPAPAFAPERPAPVAPPPAQQPVSPFRPTSRPPVAILTVCDDGKTDGETIRIRAPKFVIGRTEGDLRISIDSRISSRHVEITLQSMGGVHRWVVTDLQSTHGLFVRVSRTVLNDRSEFLVGGGRYRFESPQPAGEATMDVGAEQGPGDFGRTRGWADEPGPLRPPALTELIGGDVGNRTLLIRPEYWIGTDPSCPICRPDDPFCEPRHARLFRTPSGGWHVEHNRSFNGLWLKMSQIVVDSTIRFQVGEQRFQIRVG